MMNDPSAATMTAFVMSVVLLLGLAYLGFGERVGIKSPGPDARGSVQCPEATGDANRAADAHHSIQNPGCVTTYAMFGRLGPGNPSPRSELHLGRGTFAALSARFGLYPETVMDTTTLLIIIVVLLLIGGGGFYGRGRWF